MKITTILLLFVLAGTASIVVAQTLPSAPSADSVADIAAPEHPATPDQVREYLALVNYVGTAHKMIGQMLRASRATSAPYYTDSFWDDMEKAIMEIDLVTPVIPAYQKYFSQEDMTATIAFHKTAAGKRLLAAQPFISSAAGEVLRKAGSEAGQQVGLKHKDEIETLMKQQKQDSPARPAPNSAPVNK